MKYGIVETFVTGYKELVPNKYFSDKNKAEKYAENKNKKVAEILKRLGKKYSVKKLSKKDIRIAEAGKHFGKFSMK